MPNPRKRAMQTERILVIHKGNLSTQLFTFAFQQNSAKIIAPI